MSTYKLPPARTFPYSPFECHSQPQSTPEPLAATMFGRPRSELFFREHFAK